jgi:hypothetical protein
VIGNPVGTLRPGLLISWRQQTVKQALGHTFMQSVAACERNHGGSDGTWVHACAVGSSARGGRPGVECGSASGWVAAQHECRIAAATRS